MESSQQPKKSHPSEEIDLFELFAKTIFLIRRNVVMVIAILFIGAVLGFLNFQFSPKVYESKMLISSELLTESYSKSLTDNLAGLIREKNFKALSDKLGLPEAITFNIEGIEIRSAIARSGDVPENIKTYLIVEAKVMDNTIWPQLQNGIISYLLNNEYVKIRVEQNKRLYSQMIEKLNVELADLEKLKTKILEGQSGQSNKENLILIDPSKINSTIIDLYEEKFKAQNSLEIVNSVQVVEGFTVFNRPASPKLLASLAAGISLGLFLTLLVIVYKAVRSMVKFSEEKLGKA